MKIEKMLQHDFDEIIASNKILDKFKDSTFLITGATGLIGSLMIKFLMYLNDKMNFNIQIIGLIRNQDKANQIFKDYLSENNLKFLKHNLGSGEIQCDDRIDYIIHGVSITQSKMMIEKPVEVIKISVDGTKEVLDLAVDKKVKSMVYISSMEAYGQPDVSGKITENDLGYLDLTNPRSGYPESKRLCEVLCSSYVSEFGLSVSSARLAQTFGAGVLPTENRVFAQFARSVINGEDIVLHTQGNSEGNYIYTADLISALLTMLIFAEPGQAYNVTNEENHMTIKEMAELVVNNFGNGKSKVIIDIPKENMGYAPDVKMWLSNQKIRKLMGEVWKPSVNLVEMYRRLIDYLINNNL